jgi:hypothetical protein
MIYADEQVFLGTVKYKRLQWDRHVVIMRETMNDKEFWWGNAHLGDRKGDGMITLRCVVL